jgi:hypothetical protein
MKVGIGIRIEGGRIRRSIVIFFTYCLWDSKIFSRHCLSSRHYLLFGTTIAAKPRRAPIVFFNGTRSHTVKLERDLLLPKGQELPSNQHKKTLLLISMELLVVTDLQQLQPKHDEMPVYIPWLKATVGMGHFIFISNGSSEPLVGQLLGTCNHHF